MTRVAAARAELSLVAGARGMACPFDVTVED